MLTLARHLSCLCFRLFFGVFLSAVFSRPLPFNPRVLPPFNNSLLAWCGLNGSLSAPHNTLVFGSLCPHVSFPVATCLQKVVNCTSCPRTWFHSYVWLSTWCSLTFFSPDTRVIHLNWKIALGILYTAWHLASLRFSVPLPCFCGALFFYCPLAQSVLS